MGGGRRWRPSSRTADRGLSLLLEIWIGSCYGGVLLLAVALLVARSTHRWILLVMIAFVALLPAGRHLGRVGSVVTAWSV